MLGVGWGFVLGFGWSPDLGRSRGMVGAVLSMVVLQTGTILRGGWSGNRLDLCLRFAP